jgi:hypothetical protein
MPGLGPPPANHRIAARVGAISPSIRRVHQRPYNLPAYVFREMQMNKADSREETSPLVKDRAELEEKTIEKFDAWFRYAETIGQQRLGSYLFTASITLAAFATLYSREVFLLSCFVSIFGIIFSIMWTIIGTRQEKFHKKMEAQIDYWLDIWKKKNDDSTDKKDIKQFPIWHVRNMKKDLDEQNDTKLRWIEHTFMTRRFLWMVPSLLCVVYILCLLFALRRAAIM